MMSHLDSRLPVTSVSTPLEHASIEDGADDAAHMNLRDEWLPYKSLIGQVILDVSVHLDFSGRRKAD